MGAFITLKGFFKKHKKSYILGVIWLLLIDSVQLMVPQIIRGLANDFERGILTNTNVLK